MDERRVFLRDILSFYGHLNEQQQRELEQSISRKHFIRGEFMRSSSDNCSGLFLIKKGQVRAYIISENGREITLYRLFDRDVCLFSASCMIKDISFDIFIEVEKETDAYLIPTLVFRKLSAESVQIQSFINELMASRFSEVMWILEQVLFTSFDKRLAGYLLEQANIEGNDTIRITHEKMANDLGTAREVVTRMLKYYQNENMVTLQRGMVIIRDRGKLEGMAQ